MKRRNRIIITTLSSLMIGSAIYLAVYGIYLSKAASYGKIYLLIKDLAANPLLFFSLASLATTLLCRVKKITFSLVTCRVSAVLGAIICLVYLVFIALNFSGLAGTADGVIVRGCLFYTSNPIIFAVAGCLLSLKGTAGELE